MNSDTVKAIEDNITSILTAQGFKVEDLSTDPDVDVTPLAVILHKGEDFGAAHGQRPIYNEINYEIAIRFNQKYPSTSRDKIAEWAHKVRENIIVNGLNTGALATSKLVSWVNHVGYDIDYTPPITKLSYKLTVKYREG
mgnify:CR=1 FL=1